MSHTYDVYKCQNQLVIKKMSIFSCFSHCDINREPSYAQTYIGLWSYVNMTLGSRPYLG